MDTMKVRIDPFEESKEFTADAVEVSTANGMFLIGVDNDGNTYIGSNRKSLLVKPSSSNRILVRCE